MTRRFMNRVADRLHEFEQEIRRKYPMNEKMAEEIAEQNQSEEISHAEQAEAEKPPVADHEHVFTQGMLPGGKQVQICTFPGCGLTKGM